MALIDAVAKKANSCPWKHMRKKLCVWGIIGNCGWQWQTTNLQAQSRFHQQILSAFSLVGP